MAKKKSNQLDELVRKSMRKYKRSRRTTFSVTGLSTKIDWYLIVVVSLTIFGFLVVFSFNFYRDISDALETNPSTSDRETSIKGEDVRGILDEMKERRPLYINGDLKESETVSDATTTEEVLEDGDETTAGAEESDVEGAEDGATEAE